jgi:glutamate 5-kinase
MIAWGLGPHRSLWVVPKNHCAAGSCENAAPRPAAHPATACPAPAGAARALSEGGKSLLAIGVVDVSGEFVRGEVVACRDADGREIARGLINYSSAEARLIMRRPSSEIESILGFTEEPELIHRDNLILR